MDLSVLIPARNEDMLDRTLQDLIENIEGKTEVIVVLDGWIPNPSLKTVDPRILIVYNPVAKGQRAATNQAARLAKGKYVMKSDAHVAFDKGFDVKMLDAMHKLEASGKYLHYTLIPTMKNLWAYDWVCANGHTRYQGKKGACPTCGEVEHQNIHWTVKPSPSRFTFMFDRTMHFQYWGELAKRPESIEQGDLRETMSIQGSCFMLSKEKYWELDICSESFNSWGQQGVEVACKTWLSGGGVFSNLNTWYAHMFRTNNFGGFPYSNPESKIQANREYSRQLFQQNRWPLAIHDFQWLIDKFKPPEWIETKGIIFYTSSDLDEKIAKPVRDKLSQISQEDHLPITSTSLKPMPFGNNYSTSEPKGYITMFKQILQALENSTADIVFFTEHDILYHPSHFDFYPADKDTFYYNQNVWFLRGDGHAMHYDVNQLSGLCVNRLTAITHFKERLEKLKDPEVANNIRHMGFEPFTHGRVKWDNEFKSGTWKSKYPNIDIRVGVNPTGMRWAKEEYRNQQLLVNWTETDDQIEGWGKTSDIVKIFT